MQSVKGGRICEAFGVYLIRLGLFITFASMILDYSVGEFENRPLLVSCFRYMDLFALK